MPASDEGVTESKAGQSCLFAERQVVSCIGEAAPKCADLQAEYSRCGRAMVRGVPFVDGKDKVHSSCDALYARLEKCVVARGLFPLPPKPGAKRPAKS